jgi:hypothetical protein
MEIVLIWTLPAQNSHPALLYMVQFDVCMFPFQFGIFPLTKNTWPSSEKKSIPLCGNASLGQRTCSTIILENYPVQPTDSPHPPSEQFEKLFPLVLKLKQQHD